MDNHYHLVGYLKRGENLGPFMRQFHGSVAKLVNDLLPERLKPTISVLAERMQLQHHSTVELTDRLVERGFLCRLRATDDRRQVLVKLTGKGEIFLQKLAIHHLHELQSVGPTLVKVLHTLTQKNSLTQRSNPNEIHLATKNNRRKETSHG